ncbi:MAG: hypothetical protein GEU94_10070 [Micromonosporaceae bacterium]|nr:hypothetical protein [Micromonosporaceae bacterium]
MTDLNPPRDRGPAPTQGPYESPPGQPPQAPDAPRDTTPEPTQESDFADLNAREPDTARWEAADTRDTPARAQARHGADDDRHLLSEEERPAVGEAAVPAAKARVSWLSVTGLVLGVSGALAALTGVLAPIAVAAAVVGLLLAVGGLSAARRPHVASRPLAVTAIVFCLGALALAGLAYSGQFEWLNRPDQAGWLRDWLDQRVPWLSRV